MNNYDSYSDEELSEEVRDRHRTYEADRECALNAQKYLAKSELEYYKAKIALLERLRK